MPFAEIFQWVLEPAGAGLLILAVLWLFWKGDEQISEAFSRDLAGWLRGIPGSVPSIREVNSSIYGMFCAVYGPRHASWKCVRRSVAISVLATSYLIIPILQQPDFATDFWTAEVMDLAYRRSFLWFIPAVLIFYSANLFGDYVCSYKTRLIFKYAANRDVLLF